MRRLLSVCELQYTGGVFWCEPRASSEPRGLSRWLYVAGMNLVARRITRTHPFLPSSRTMADTFDPYREALIVEVETAWPDEYDDWEPAELARVERLLHQSPEVASHLEYVRTH